MGSEMCIRDSLYSNSKKPGVRREHKEVASGDILRVVASRYGCTKKDLLTAKRGSGVDNTTQREQWQ